MTSSKPAPEPSASATAYRRALGGLTISLLASWVLMMSPLPYALLAGVTGLVAGVFLVLVAIRGWREGRRTTAVIALVFGLPAVGMMLLSSLTSAIFYQPMVEMQECRQSAITEQARAECEQQAQQSVSGWIGRLVGG
ncbi:hypothetical protein [Brachybacterium phenoliresistens]|uniref:Uncharacterized protein n=1 Tax=Brachybacterium phenoliresistens TaxID=396014 RepID=Z9JUD5_9MICO|nr:hypothetical protein [Brachybacterium phenoliresistens]EWS81975.1 hypothetical protein BF93_14195 [Brachybacterium phenoliresistens]